MHRKMQESGLTEITPLISTSAVEGWCPIRSHMGISWWYWWNPGAPIWVHGWGWLPWLRAWQRASSFHSESPRGPRQERAAAVTDGSNVFCLLIRQERIFIHEENEETEAEIDTAVEVRSLNHCTPREVPRNHLALTRMFSSVAQLCPTLCNPIDWNMPGLPVHHQLLEFRSTKGKDQSETDTKECGTWDTN